jgi:hypothetical protein
LEPVDRFETIAVWGLGFSLLIVLTFVVYVRVHFLEVPLERDEGEYAYAGQLILQGIPPYGSLYSMKFPGIYAAYAVIMGLCGQTHWGIHFGLLIINLLTATGLVLLGSVLLDSTVGICAGAFFAVLSLSPTMQGIFANAEHFVILCVVSGLLVMLIGLRVNSTTRLFWAGVLLGIAGLMKQQGIAIVAFAGLFFLYEKLKVGAGDRGPFARQLGILVLGGLSPLILTGLVLWMAGVFEQFWFWTFVYAAKYIEGGSYIPTISRLTAIWTSIFKAGPLVWILAALGLTSFLWDNKSRPLLVFLGGFAVFSVAAVCPGLIFRPHYFILLLPAVSLLAGVCVSAAGRLASQLECRRVGIAIPVVITILTVAHSVYIHRGFYFEVSPLAASRIVYGQNPFPETLRIGEYIAKHSNPQDRIAVLGSEPEIYFYARRMAATSFVYMYPMMENHEFAAEMQRDMIRQIESAAPRFLILVNVWDSWLVTPQSNMTIFEWSRRYVKEWYEVVGFADMISPQETRYWWADGQTDYSPESRMSVAAYRRKTQQ